MARDLIKDGQVYLPCRLDPSLLEAICNEIKELHGTLENKYQFARELPKLTKYLNAYPVVGLNNSDQWMEKLSSVSKDLDKVFSRGEEFAGKWDKFYKTYLLGMEYEEQLANEAMKPQLEELQRYQEEARIRCGQKPIKREPAPAPDPNVIADLQAVQEKLAKFGSLYKSYQQAQNLVFPYNEIKDLMMRAICLPQAESDLLMRYQTTLERRLSMSIGELLELQRAKNPH